ncbi:hypothetical protein PILCRDRAFT_54215, partial [Piloderma croceum F 1598]
QITHIKNMMAAPGPQVYPRHPIPCRGLLCGKVSMMGVELQKVQNENPAYFVEWIPNVLTAQCDIPPRGRKMVVTFLVNSAAIREFFKRVNNRFAATLERKAFSHW